MTNERINIKIAELCNLFRIAPLKRTTRKGNDDPNGVVLWYCSEDHGGAKTYDRLPNYAADLNACHEFAAWLNLEQQIKFAEELQCIILENPYRAWWNATAIEVFQIADATARQRCEAFLRVHGQWEEEA